MKTRMLRKGYFGWTIGVLMLLTLGLSASVFAQNPNDVIINEYNEEGNAGGAPDGGVPEWVELLVVNGPVTMRNWFLTDEEPDIMPATLSSIPGESIVQFKDNPAFDNIPMGTYIVIHDGTGTDDANFSDRKIEFFIDNPTSDFITRYGSFDIAAGTENLTLYKYLSGDPDTFINFAGIDHINWGASVNPPVGVTWATPITGAEDEDAYFSDRVNFNNDDQSKWVKDADASGTARTKGAANLGQDDTSLPVELSFFTATSAKDGVILRWRTESETNNLGFRIYRSDRRDGKYVRVNPVMVRGAGTSAASHTYEFKDTDVEGRIVYYYIEDVAFDGSTSRSPIIQARRAIAFSEMRLLPWGQLKRN